MSCTLPHCRSWAPPPARTNHSNEKPSFHTAPDTRSNAPARRDEDRVIRPLACFRRCELRIIRFRASAKAHSLRCISSSGKIIRFCRSLIMAGFPRAISSLGAAIQLSARFAISNREYPVSNRLCLAEESSSPRPGAAAARAKLWERIYFTAKRR